MVCSSVLESAAVHAGVQKKQQHASVLSNWALNRNIRDPLGSCIATDVSFTCFSCCALALQLARQQACDIVPL